jgi:hypothetical protein
MESFENQLGAIIGRLHVNQSIPTSSVELLHFDSINQAILKLLIVKYNQALDNANKTKCNASK